MIQKVIDRINRNKCTIQFCESSFQSKKINLNYCTGLNLGDLLSPIVCEYLLAKKGLSLSTTVKQTKHLYAIGSILTMGKQDAVVWGSGAIDNESLYTLWGDRNSLKRRLDIRAVRGRYTKEILQKAGYEVPNIFGDPAIIMPEIYDPRQSNPQIKKYKASVIVHFDKVPEEWKKNSEINFLSIRTVDYKKFIDEILASEKVISSSLHGIILAESYGVPAVMILNDVWDQIFKFYDWYSATDREDFAIASSLSNALKMEGTPIPDMSQLRHQLMNSFPYDLFR